MTEEKIQELMRQCEVNTATPWNKLLNAYVTQLAAISPSLPDDALDAMIRLGAACHRKAFAELAASEQTEIALHRIRHEASRRAGTSRFSIDPLLD